MGEARPGEYDELCAYIQAQTQATGVVVMIFGGEHGNGYSILAGDPVTRLLPELLRAVANRIERGLREKGTSNPG